MTRFRIVLFVLSLLLTGLFSTSCFTTLALLSSAASWSSNNNISREKTYLDLKIIQVLGKGEALAVTDKFDVVKIESLNDIYYDGKKVSGNFTLLDTYTYQTKKGQWKTVPIYIMTKEYKKNKRL